MISLLLSSASRKAWVSGLVAALLTPAYELLRSGGEITLRTVGVAVIAGLLSAAVVFGTTNTPPGPVTDPNVTLVEDTPGKHEADR